MDASFERVRITVQLRADVARELAIPSSHSETVHQLTDLLDQSRATIEPVFSGASEPDLEGWFTVTAPASDASALLARLQNQDAVLAAYIKPRETPP